MAKELPFFKFEPNQWDNGNIQMLSMSDKGLFMDLCSMYWSRLGDVPLKLAMRKLSDGNATAFDSLIKEKIFTIEDNHICIDFLNEQLSEFENISKTNSKNAKDGWVKRRKNRDLKRPQSDGNATASKPQSETHAIREDKSRIDKSKVDGEYTPAPSKIDLTPEKINKLMDNFISEVKNGEHNQAIETWYMSLKVKKGSLQTLLEEFRGQLITDNKLHKNTLELRKHYKNWLNTLDKAGKLNQYRTVKTI